MNICKCLGSRLQKNILITLFRCCFVKKKPTKCFQNPGLLKTPLTPRSTHWDWPNCKRLQTQRVGSIRCWTPGDVGVFHKTFGGIPQDVCQDIPGAPDKFKKVCWVNSCPLPCDQTFLHYSKIISPGINVGMPLHDFYRKSIKLKWFCFTLHYHDRNL